MHAQPAVDDSQLRRVFDAVDRDGSGGIDAEELQHALRIAGLSLTRRTCTMLVRMHDVDLSGTVDFGEFTHMNHFIKSVQWSFYTFDFSRNGLLERSELRQALRLNEFVLSDVAFESLFTSFDEKHRNALTIGEYLSLAVYLLCVRNLFTSLARGQVKSVTLDFDQFCWALSSLR